MRPITRPGENQRLLYNGHKRVHGLKFQSVVLPNGLIAHLYGPVGKACSKQITMHAYKIRTKFQTRKRRVRISWAFPLPALTLNPPAHFLLAFLRQQ